MKTVIEPFRIKMVEPIRMTTVVEQEQILKKANYNLFLVPAKDVLIDLLTDSGTAAMSAAQWAGMMEGDESYAGSKSFERFEKVVKELTGYPYIIPVHQGRAAEKILFHVAIRHLGSRQPMVPNNTHFDTTRANVEYLGAKAIDFPVLEASQPALRKPFKGNMDLEKLENFLNQHAKKDVPLIMMTITNNSRGGQPVSMQNLKGVQKLAQKYKIPFFLDAARFAENAYFIQQREPKYNTKTVKEIAQEIFRLSDGCTMSAKKDGLVNMGGFLAFHSKKWAMSARSLLILTEGFPTYGGLAGRDLEAIAQGLEEVVDEDYLKYRIRTIEYIAIRLIQMGIPIVQPPGGHAIYIDAASFLKHIPRSQFPGQSLVCELYVRGGVRGVEIGSVMFGANTDMELVRLAFPRRVYTQSHVDYLLEVIEEITKNKSRLHGYKITYEEPIMRHFTAHFKPI